MSIDMVEKNDKIDRKTTARLLKVSVRTVDRYIKAKKLSTWSVDGRIWLDRREVLTFRDAKSKCNKVDIVDMSTPALSIEKTVDTVDKIYVDIEKNVNIQRAGKIPQGASDPFKQLFVQLKQELSEKQERLEIANYRVGQLETQLKNSVPMLEYYRESFLRQEKEEELNRYLNESKEVVKGLYRKVRTERRARIFFFIALLVVLALQPIIAIYLT